jgi:hypothetical protein
MTQEETPHMTATIYFFLLSKKCTFLVRVKGLTVYLAKEKQCFFAVLGFELRASCLPGRCSTT